MILTDEDILIDTRYLIDTLIGPRNQDKVFLNKYFSLYLRCLKIRY